MKTKLTWFTVHSALAPRRVKIEDRKGEIYDAFYRTEKGGWHEGRLFAKLDYRQERWFFTWAISTPEHRLPAHGFGSLQDAIDYYDRNLAIDIDHYTARQESASYSLGGFSA